MQIKGFARQIHTFLLNRPVIVALILISLLAGLLGYGLRVRRAQPELSVMPGMRAGSRSDFDDYFQASRSFTSQVADPYHTGNLAKASALFDQANQNPSALLQAIILLKDVGRYLYPPFLAFLLTPLTALDYADAALVFQLFSVLALGLAGLVSLRIGRSAGVANKSNRLMLLYGSVLVLGFLSGNIANGNIGFFLILLLIGGLYLAWQPGWLLPFLGGILFGLATVMKVTPLFWGLVLLAGRRWLAGVGMLIGIALALLTPALYYGFGSNWAYLQDWYGLIIDSYSRLTFVRSWQNNQTVVAMIGRFFVEGQDASQYQWGLPIVTEPGGSQLLRMQFMANIARFINMGLYLMVFILALRSGLQGGWGAIKQSLTGLLKLDTSRQLMEPTFLRLLILVISVSLLGSGVSWFHAYSLLWVPIVLGLPFVMRAEHKRGSLDLQLFLIVSGFFGLLYHVLPTGLQEGLAIYSVYVLCQLPLLVFIWLRAMRFSDLAEAQYGI